MTEPSALLKRATWNSTEGPLPAVPAGLIGSLLATARTCARPKIFAAAPRRHRHGLDLQRLAQVVGAEVDARRRAAAADAVQPGGEPGHLLDALDGDLRRTRRRFVLCFRALELSLLRLAERLLRPQH